MGRDIHFYETYRLQLDEQQWLKWACEAGVGGEGSPDEARLEQTQYPFHTQLI